ncbi:molybdate ABC transporter substrate-binding protein [Listeria floridensis FSL S10-1187]|uniref:Molybdate ABC transporter substrate-binding protein n=1 Tax=Listeria floridensis FSL S10-1187 TaxID=1265817 RepID=A0ABP3AVW0_9LIST|nr:molybdate ABC transporter substrate-binding protein [Listeria floridensis]EUJ26116.1 molybdate ABC transporter substrate-binding protein [Listeria floridensis FSL S10-1187]
MKLRKWGVLAVVFLLTILAACGNSSSEKADKKTNEKVDIHISAAASLKDAIDDIKPLYERAHPNTKLTFDFGGSGQIRARVMSGSPIDGILFASASDINQLVKADKASGKAEFAQNTLVLIEPVNSENSTSNLADRLKGYQKFALGNPDSVPAGKYGKETLENLKVYDAMKDKIVLASDVRQVLSYVSAGNADAGFVYKTDALISDKVKVVETVADGIHSPIGYYSGVVTDTEHKKQVQSFLSFMREAGAQKVLKKYGFKEGN